MGLLDFFTPEAGQRRRAWLDNGAARAGAVADYYLGPTGIPDRVAKLGGLLEFSDAGDIAATADASRNLWNNPSVKTAADFTAAGAAMMMPMYSHKLGEGIMDMADSMVDAYNPNQVNVFAGLNANPKMIDRDALEMAQAMTRDNVDRGEIWESTGFMLGQDGKWRFEIPDLEANIAGGSFDAMAARRPRKLGEALDHPRLYEAYPHMRNMGFSASDVPDAGVQGAYFPADRFSPEKITLDRSAKYPTSTLLHEAQHGIQAFEDFGGRGTNPSAMSRDNLDNLLRERRGELMGERDRLLRLARGAAPDPAVQSEIDMLATEGQRLHDLANIDPHERYMREAGEVEGRNVQVRQFMDSLDRSYNLPWETADRPEWQQFSYDSRGGDVYPSLMPDPDQERILKIMARMRGRNQ